MENLILILFSVGCYGLGVVTSYVFFQRKLKKLHDKYSKRLSNAVSGAIEYANELGLQWEEKHAIKSERDKYKKLAYEMDQARKKVVVERDLLLRQKEG